MYVRKRVVNILRVVVESGVESIAKTCDIIQYDKFKCRT
jgi:hypothetical protein